jgi:hypothetical protein
MELLFHSNRVTTAAPRLSCTTHFLAQKPHDHLLRLVAGEAYSAGPPGCRYKAAIEAHERARMYRRPTWLI